ncbi:MAG: hypothetical protein ABSF51_09085 [Verrucomicrobiota bacterium]|jgi:hypothetical protein
MRILTLMKIKQKTTFLNFFCERKIRLNKKHGSVDRFKIDLGIVLGIALLVPLTGCIGFVGGDGGYAGGVVVAEPDLFLFGGGYDRGGDVHGYSHRGAASRAVAHPSGGGHGGGGGGHTGGGGKK